jgi:hypothetical protein
MSDIVDVLEAWEAPTPRPSGKVAQARKDSKG